MVTFKGKLIKNPLVYELNVKEEGVDVLSNIDTALEYSEAELEKVVDRIAETEETIKNLTPECDKTDYVLASVIGILCGVMDIFLVGKPGESTLGNLTDSWFENRTKDFAKMCGWENDGNAKSAIKFLEDKFKIPYDQTGVGGASRFVFDLKPKNHHFKSLGHNPTLLGLFFSIMDQFCNTSHFITDGELISLQQADDKFVLRGNDVPSKLFCGFINWFGHLISDMSGSYGSKGRGMGIPSPFLSWTNDIIALKRKANLSVTALDKNMNEFALKIYSEGYDVRFQSVQAIPVFINEVLVRFMYSIRRMYKYFMTTSKEDRNMKMLWKSCEPFSNATVKRMLTVAHGCFCLVDIGDAAIQGYAKGAGGFNFAEFFMRINIVGIGRFTISVHGEISRGIEKGRVCDENLYLIRSKIIIEDYIRELKYLSEIYDDANLLNFVEDLENSDSYKIGFYKTVELMRKRGVGNNEGLEDKEDIDYYFLGGYYEKE